eukprot:1156040-Pelagomonas_calceolata.AAC.1
MDCPLQTVHLCLLKRILGVKRTTPNWSVLRVCEHGEHMNKLAKYHRWVALPLKSLPAHSAPFSIPRYLHLDLGKHKLRNIARFRLHAHTLEIKTALWQEHTSKCDRCDQKELQDEKHYRLFLDESGAFCYTQAGPDDAEQPNYLAEEAPVQEIYAGGFGGAKRHGQTADQETRVRSHKTAQAIKATWVPSRRYGGVYGGPQGPSKPRAMFGRDYRGYCTDEEIQARQCN